VELSEQEQIGKGGPEFSLLTFCVFGCC